MSSATVDGMVDYEKIVRHPLIFVPSANQTWHAGKWTIQICDFPSSKPPLMTPEGRDSHHGMTTTHRVAQPPVARYLKKAGHHVVAPLEAQRYRSEASRGCFGGQRVWMQWGCTRCICIMYMYIIIIIYIYIDMCIYIYMYE